MKNKADAIKETNDLLSSTRHLRMWLEVNQEDVFIINEATFSGVLHYGVIIRIPGSEKETIGWIPASLFKSCKQ